MPKDHRSMPSAGSETESSNIMDMSLNAFAVNYFGHLPQTLDALESVTHLRGVLTQRDLLGGRFTW